MLRAFLPPPLSDKSAICQETLFECPQSSTLIWRYLKTSVWVDTGQSSCAGRCTIFLIGPISAILMALFNLAWPRSDRTHLIHVRQPISVRLFTLRPGVLRLVRRPALARRPVREVIA